MQKLNAGNSSPESNMTLCEFVEAVYLPWVQLERRAATGVMFHTGSGNRMDMDKLAQRMIRPAMRAIGPPWYGWHGFRRGIASNLYELGANEKIVQRVLRHANPHVTKDRYIKAFDPAVLEAMRRMQATLDVLESSPAIVQQVS